MSFLSSGQNTEALILSGDHVYCMDYGPLVQFHRANRAHVTIGMIRVPWGETRHFGTGTLDGENRIVDWEEKSKRARSNLASMGIYVFDRDYLVTTLSKTKEEDFGSQIIPRALKGAKVFGYPFEGYWRDVGTIDAYWDANMDLLRPGSGLSPEACGIRTNQSADQLPYDRPPVRIIGSAHVANAAVSPGCVIQGSVENSILSPGVIIEKGAFVKDSIIMHDAKVGKGTRIERSIIDKEASIGEESVIGQGNPRVANARFPDHVYSGLTLIGKRASIPSHSRIGTNCIVHPDVREDDFPSRELADGGTQEK